MDKSKKIQWGINLLIPIIIALMPTSESFTPEIKLFFSITIFAILLLAFESIHITITSLALPVIYIITKLAPPDLAFKSWSLDVTWLLLGGFMFTFALQSSGLIKRLAYKSILLVGGKFKGILYGLTFSGFILALVIPDAGARTVLYVALTLGICEALNLKQKSKAGSAVMIAGIFAALNPGNMYMSGSGQTLIPLNIAAGMGVNVTWMQYLTHMFVPVLIWSLINVVLLQLLLKPEEEFKSKDYFKKELTKLGKITATEFKLLVVLAIVVALLVTSGLHGIKIGWIFVLAACVLYLPGLNIADPKDLPKINYGFIIFVTACLTIGIVSGFIGAGKFVSDAIYPMLGGSTAGSLAGVWGLAVTINFILTPLAATSALAAPLVELANSLGINPLPVLYTFVQGIENILLPYEYALVLLPFSYGYISLKNLMKVFGARMIASLVCILILYIPYWKFIGLL
jgi:anion transporter